MLDVFDEGRFTPRKIEVAQFDKFSLSDVCPSMHQNVQAVLEIPPHAFCESCRVLSKTVHMSHMSA